MTFVGLIYSEGKNGCQRRFISQVPGFFPARFNAPYLGNLFCKLKHATELTDRADHQLTLHNFGTDL